jgi:hypothetical protein
MKMDVVEGKRKRERGREAFIKWPQTIKCIFLARNNARKVC